MPTVEVSAGPIEYTDTGSYTLVPIDQPELLAAALREFADN